MNILKFNINRSSILTKSLLLLLLLFLGVGEMRGNSYSYKATVTAKSNGNGKVYASDTNKEIGVISEWEEAESVSTQEGTSDASGSDVSLTFWIYAKPNEHYLFLKWDDDNAEQKRSISLTATSSSTEPTATYKASFKQLPYFNFSATATAYTGGSASSNWTNETVWGTTLSQTSASKDVTYTASLTDQNYYFVGWTATNGSTNPELGTNTSLTRTLTNNTPGSTMSDHVYAIFKPLYQFKAVANKTPDAGGTVKITKGTGTDDINNQKFTSQSNSISDIKFSATAASKYSFTGWSDTETGSVVSANNPYTISITSTSTDPNAPTTKTLWANFTPFPTFYFKAAGAVSPAGSGTVSVTGSTLSKQADSAGATSLTMTTSYTATSSDPELYTFAGWKSSTTASSYASTENPADLTLTSNSKSSTSPITTTWYAIFTKKADVTSISLTQSSMTLKQKQSASIAYSLLPSGCYEKLEFASNNTAVATVTSGGVVKGVSQGSTTVTIKAYKTDKTSYVTATVNVTVTNEVASQVGMTFTEGTTPGSLSCFDDFNIPNINLTVSNCIIMPGRHDGSRKDPDGNVIVDFKGTLLEGGKSVKLTGNQQVDCETFYFATYNTTNLNNGTLWAYSFTGWHITNTNTSSTIASIKEEKKVPGQTVFQPGDVITPEILKEYGILDSDGNVKAGATLNFEALWGKVWFMMDGRQGNGSGTATGNDFTKPNNNTATIIGKKENSETPGKVPQSSDAFQSVVMLSGDYDHGSGALTPVTGAAYTYKSLQRENNSGTIGAMKDGQRYVVFTQGTGQPKNYASFRLDNVKGSFRYKSEYYSSGSYKDGGNQSYRTYKADYIETTARFSGNLGQLVRIEPDNIKGFVATLNGGTISEAEVFGSASTSTFNDTPRYFYLGRNFKFQTVFITGPSGFKGSSTGDVYVTVSGGDIHAFSGTANFGVTCTGNRYYCLYGNQSGNTEYDPKVGMFTSAADAPLIGDAVVKVNGCTNLKDVYGGGDVFTATVNNVTLSIDNSTLQGSVYGGGRYGSTSGKATVKISNSTVTGNVYGSGMGSTSSVTTSNKDAEAMYKTSEFPTATPPTGFPVFYRNASTYDGSTIPAGSVIAYRLETAGVWGGDPYSDYINRRLFSFFFLLSTAQANETEITIDHSTIGSNVYGGGAIAKVTGNTSISITGKSTISGSVYGGGDGVTTPAKVRICEPLSSLTEQPKPAEARTKNIADPNSYYDYQRKNPFEDDYGVDCEWSGDATLLNQTKYPGIDLVNKKVYSPNMTGWGDVLGKTQVTIQGGSHVYGNVYGGGNAGKVGPESGMLSGAIVTSIENSTVDGSVYGGCNNAEMKAATQVRILGNSTVGNVYGGGNAGVVQGTTNVQIGQ